MPSVNGNTLTIVEKLQTVDTLDEMLKVVQHEISVGLSQQKIFFHKGTSGRKKWASSHEADAAEEKRFVTEFQREALEGLAIVEQKGLEMLESGNLSYEAYDEKVGLFLYNTRKNLSLRLMEACKEPEHNPPYLSI